jgi:predicted nucleotidyltransferase
LQERQLAEDNKILLIRAGSHLYGTNTPESDEDFVGVFMPDKKHVFGFNHVEEVDLSVKNKNEDGKNTKDAIDKKLYEYRKFIKLAIEVNPNIIELLFVNPENVLFINDYGKRLLEKRHLFPWIQTRKKILAYAFNQKHKIFIKRDNYLDIISGIDYLESLNNDTMYLAEAVQKTTFGQSIFKIRYDKDQNTKFVQIGDLNLQPYYHAKRAKEILQARADRFGHRLELVNKYSYDTKFAGNVIRLLFNGRRILKTCELVMPFPEDERKILLEIKTGKWSLSQILDYSNELEREINALEKDTKLPKEPKTKEIEEFMISELWNFLHEQERQ